MSEMLKYDYLNVQITGKEAEKGAKGKYDKYASLAHFKRKQQKAEARAKVDLGDQPTKALTTTKTSFETNKLKHKYEILSRRKVARLRDQPNSDESELRKMLIWNKEGPSIEVS